jgi:hypothetical protein
LLSRLSVANDALGAAAVADGELVGRIWREETGDEAEAVGEGLRGEKRVFTFA